MDLTKRITRLVETIDVTVPGGRWQFFEICDLGWCPSLIQHYCQDTLTAHWLHKLPFVHQQSPAELAATAILGVLDRIKDIDEVDWQVIDFCSGAGGPIPEIETHINRHRTHPISFRLSDLHPNLDAWIIHASRSPYLTFLPQPVDASNPPVAAISSTTPGENGLRSSDSKVFRTFCLSFHHFDDVAATRVLKSTLATSDGFAIVELQDRRVTSLLLMVAEFFLVYLVTAIWFWDEPFRVYLTFGVPLLPFVHFFDGTVSSMRTRTLAETLTLVDDVLQVPGEPIQPKKGGGLVARRGEWEFEYDRRLHTWPLGYMNIISGRKV